MGEINSSEEIVSRLRQQVRNDAVRITLHANHEMNEESISYSSMAQAMLTGKVIENYPTHQRGACCLICGKDASGRFLHICCTTSLDVIIVITAYEPKLPKWLDPYNRR
ncbi:MAG: hypothetical protein DRP83_09275 [Planctomycetota bacterium]|nr:MAG: hypothetical protein DRP83_09275 [Planctomycetota bacterium]